MVFGCGIWELYLIAVFGCDILWALHLVVTFDCCIWLWYFVVSFDCSILLMFVVTFGCALGDVILAIKTVSQKTEPYLSCMKSADRIVLDWVLGSRCYTGWFWSLVVGFRGFGRFACWVS